MTTRRERREADLASRRQQRRTRHTGKKSAWRSPMVLLTVGALAIGLAIVAVSVLGQPGTPSTADLERPVAQIPATLVDGRALGKADAPVTIEIWSDFQCPACRTLGETVEPAVIADFVIPGTARLVYRDAAYQGARAGRPYDELVEAAAGARCAADEGHFWTMHNWLFANWDGENRGAFAAERLRAIAAAAEVDLTAWDACMATGDEQAAVRAETQEAVAAGINSTPTLVINGERVVGVPEYAVLAAAITRAAGQP